jgi:hypothetical protein
VDLFRKKYSRDAARNGKEPETKRSSDEEIEKTRRHEPAFFLAPAQRESCE